MLVKSRVNSLDFISLLCYNINGISFKILKRKERNVIHKVKCYYCKKYFDRDKETAVKVNYNRYAHEACYKQNNKEAIQYENLITYIECLFNLEEASDKIKLQMQKYHREYGYTFSGMQKALKYFYEIKKQPIEKAKESCGILPYIYSEAEQYYKSIYEAQKSNIDKDINNYVPKERIIKIEPPKRNTRKRNLFSFLDQEVTNDGE